MQSTKRERSVKTLVELYTVIIGVALSLSLVTLIDRDTGIESVTAANVLLFVAFCLTLFPFYHGAIRHLDDAYIENEHVQIKDGALIIDFVLLFMHALVLVILSLLLNNPAQFAWFLIGMLVIDVVWGLFAHFASSSRSEGMTAEFKWMLINFVFVAITLLYLISNDIWLRSSPDVFKLSTFIVIACALRTLVDYVWCYKFYFPR